MLMKLSLKDITVFTQARKNSRRCQNKLLRPFAGSTLIDICLEKMNDFQAYKVYFGAAEQEFIEKASKFRNIKFIKRSQDSADENTSAKKVFEILNEFTTTFVCWINPCHPFLRKETIENAIEKFLDSPSPSLTSVVLEKGWYFDSNKTAVTNRSLQVDTAIADGVYRVAHAFHIYNREHLIEHGRLWNNKPNDPYLFQIPHIESLDIDTENEFIMVEKLYSHYHNKQNC